jgi:3-phosphoshikimate 1-carboxyvinyltransferase
MVQPSDNLIAGNSGTTMRLLAGILAGQQFQTVLTGDSSLSRRPMRRIIEPLRLMGAQVGAAEGDVPPLTIRGGNLKALRYSLPVASAQVKSCILMAGLYGDGITSVRECIPTRDHTEIALSHFGAVLHESEDWIAVEPNPRLQCRSLDIPGDLSSAAFFISAAALIPESDIFLPNVGLNRRRRRLLRYLRNSGVDISVENESSKAGEPRGDVRVCYRSDFLAGRLDPIQGKDAAGLIDEIPVLAVLGSQVGGGVEIRGAQELRVKESDRIAAVTQNLRAMGADVEEYADGLLVGGGQKLEGTSVDTRGDHRIAMAFTVAGLVAEGTTRICQSECVDVSYPGFWEDVARTVE